MRRVPVVRQLMRFMAIVGCAVVLSALVASSTVAAKGNSNKFFVGQKTCTPHATPPLFTCVMSASNVPLLQDATVKYISVPATFPDPAPGRIDSDVVLTTADAVSTANGHCTFYMSTHTGLCTYQKGTHALSGFKAVCVVGPLAPFVPGHFSVIGKYTIGEHDD
jgi:hypothetical protein